MAFSPVKYKPVVLITGASQGIGEAIAKVFAQEVRGGRLALVARNVRGLQATAKACVKFGAKAEAFECDVSNETSVGLMAEAVQERFGRVEVLINNAGAFTMAPFVETKVAEFDRMIAVNLRSAFLVTQAFLPAMLQRRRGDIFFMSSIAGLGRVPALHRRTARPKFGLTGWPRCCAPRRRIPAFACVVCTPARRGRRRGARAA